MISTIEDNIEAIIASCQNHSVKSAYLFGSAVSKSFTSESDLDILVEFEEMDLYLFADNYFQLKESLESITNRDVDLVIEKDLTNPVLIRSINKERKLLYDRKDREMVN